MEIRSRMFEQYMGYHFFIPLSSGDRVIAKSKQISQGDVLLIKSENALKKSLSLQKSLKCKNNDFEKYILRLDGEYVEEGDILAQKVSSGGLRFIEIKSPVSGVVDLSRVKQGYIDILGEQRESIIKSDFNGYICNIDPNKGLEITTNVICIDGVISSKAGSSFTGILDILGDGNTIFTEKILQEDYRGKIVWVGPYLYSKVAYELFERGAVAVLTYAMSYTEFREIGLPIMVLGGFGSVHCDNFFLKRFISFKDKFVILNSKENQLFVLSETDIKHRGWFVDQYINQYVISRATSTNGYIGKVVEYAQDTKFALVDFGKRGSSLIHIGLLEFLDL